MTLYLVQCGQTDWQAGGRLQGRLSLPLSAVGQEQCSLAARRLAEVELAAVYCPPCEACQQTARAIAADHRGCKVRKETGLVEVDLGLWQGMTTEEIKRRHPRVYKQWLDDPGSVTPPEGEGFQDALERTSAAVGRIVRRHDVSNAALVVPPLMAALVRCVLTGGQLADFWRLTAGDPTSPQEFLPRPAEKG